MGWDDRIQTWVGHTLDKHPTYYFSSPLDWMKLDSDLSSNYLLSFIQEYWKLRSRENVIWGNQSRQCSLPFLQLDFHQFCDLHIFCMKLNESNLTNFHLISCKWRILSWKRGKGSFNVIKKSLSKQSGKPPSSEQYLKLHREKTIAWESLTCY